MNFPSDTPQWLIDLIDGLEMKARRQLVKGELSPDRAAGYFCACSDLQDEIEGIARIEQSEIDQRRKALDERRVNGVS